MNNPRLAKTGENLAADFLAGKGLIIKERNYRCPLGEVDIILWDKDTLVFCEVKTRSSLNYGHPLEAISKQKINRISKIASYYIRSQNANFRIDAVGIYFENGEPKIEWIENCTM